MDGWMTVCICFIYLSMHWIKKIWMWNKCLILGYDKSFADLLLCWNLPKCFLWSCSWGLTQQTTDCLRQRCKRQDIYPTGFHNYRTRQNKTKKLFFSSWHESQTVAVRYSIWQTDTTTIQRKTYEVSLSLGLTDLTSFTASCAASLLQNVMKAYPRFWPDSGSIISRRSQIGPAFSKSGTSSSSYKSRGIFPTNTCDRRTML